MSPSIEYLVCVPHVHKHAFDINQQGGLKKLSFVKNSRIKVGRRGAAIPRCPVEVEEARRPQPHQQVLQNPAQLKNGTFFNRMSFHS